MKMKMTRGLTKCRNKFNIFPEYEL